MEALARFVEYYNYERLHETIPQMGARTLSKENRPNGPRRSDDVHSLARRACSTKRNRNRAASATR